MELEEEALTRHIRDSATQLQVRDVPLADIERQGRRVALRRTRFAMAGVCVVALSIGWGVTALVQADSPGGRDMAGRPNDSSASLWTVVPPVDMQAVRACLADPRTSGDFTMSAPLIEGYPSPEAAAKPMIEVPNPPDGMRGPIDVREGDVAVEASREASTAHVALMRSDGTVYTVLVTKRDAAGEWHVEGIRGCRAPGSS